MGNCWESEVDLDDSTWSVWIWSLLAIQQLVAGKSYSTIYTESHNEILHWLH